MKNTNTNNFKNAADDSASCFVMFSSISKS